nr:hypothetical protein [uncultured Methanobrevibacter sp.]
MLVGIQFISHSPIIIRKHECFFIALFDLFYGVIFFLSCFLMRLSFGRWFCRISSVFGM